MPNNNDKTVLGTAGAARAPEKATACGGRPKQGSKQNGTVPHFKARQPAAHGAVEAVLKFYAPTGDQGDQGDQGEGGAA